MRTNFKATGAGGAIKQRQEFSLKLSELKKLEAPAPFPMFYKITFVSLIIKQEESFDNTMNVPDFEKGGSLCPKVENDVIISNTSNEVQSLINFSARYEVHKDVFLSSKITTPFDQNHSQSFAFKTFKTTRDIFRSIIGEMILQGSNDQQSDD